MICPCFLYAVMICPCLLHFYAIAAVWFCRTAGILYACNQIHVVTYFTLDRSFKFCLTKKIFMLVKKFFVGSVLSVYTFSN